MRPFVSVDDPVMAANDNVYGNLEAGKAVNRPVLDAAPEHPRTALWRRLARGTGRHGCVILFGIVVVIAAVTLGVGLGLGLRPECQCNVRREVTLSNGNIIDPGSSICTTPESKRCGH